MRTEMLVRTALFLALTLALQGIRLPPLLTGPLVNFLLALATLLCGTASGIIIGLLTPWAALFLGILPAPLAPAIPFIIIGNAFYAFLIGSIHRLFPNKFSVIGGVVAGAAVKFIIIAGATSYILTLPGPLTSILLFPQLANALTGGLLAATIIISGHLQPYTLNKGNQPPS